MTKAEKLKRKLDTRKEYLQFMKDNNWDQQYIEIVNSEIQDLQNKLIT